MPEINLVLDHTTGALLIEAPQRLPDAVLRDFADLLGGGQSIGCARPSELCLPPIEAGDEAAPGLFVRIAGYYHNSLIEGPGRRSCVLLSGCDLKCKGC